MGNTITILLGIIVFFMVINFFYNLGKESNTGGNVAAKRQISDAEAKKAIAVVANALEKVIDDVVGQTFGREDRQKIAVGMIAVMAAENISLNQLVNNEKTFAAVMLKSIAILKNSGQISGR